VLIPGEEGALRGSDEEKQNIFHDSSSEPRRCQSLL